MRLGNEPRSFAVVPDLMLQSSVVYSFGIDENANFDIELVGCFGCSVYLFDPRPTNLAWIRDQTLPPQFKVHAFGLSDRDGIMSHAPRETSTANQARRTHHPSFEYQVRRLTTLMRQLSHLHIDVLKLELDGAEYAGIRALASSNIRPTQVLIEFQHPNREFSPARCERALMQLNELGYRTFDCQPGGHRFSLALV
jgi:FkbM family methyltransferase